MFEKSLQRANLKVTLPDLLLPGLGFNIFRYRYTLSLFKRILFRGSECHNFLPKTILIIFQRSFLVRLLFFQGHQLRGPFKGRDLLGTLSKIFRRDQGQAWASCDCSSVDFILESECWLSDHAGELRCWLWC